MTIVYTIGNFFPLPWALNQPRSKSAKDYWDLALPERIDPRDEATLYVLGNMIDRGRMAARSRPNVLPILPTTSLPPSYICHGCCGRSPSQNFAELDETQVTALGEWMTNGDTTTLRELNRPSLEAREEILGANRSNKP